MKVSLLFISLLLLPGFASADQLEVSPEQIMVLTEKDFAHEHPGYTEVNLSSLVLRGRGLQNRKSQDTIAIACVGPDEQGKPASNCSVLQHVFLEAQTGKAYLVGRTYQVSYGLNPSDKEFKKAYKEINRRYRLMKRRAHPERGMFVMLGAFGLGSFTIFEIIPYSVMMGAIGMTPAGFVICFGYMASVAALGFIYNAQGSLLTGSGKGTTNVLHDQSGWSWSVEPERIGASRFNSYLKFLGLPLATPDIEQNPALVQP